MGVTNRRAAVKKIKQLIYTPKSDTSIFRKKIEDSFSVVSIPNNVECVEKEIGAVVCDELTPIVCAENRIMIYIHGGSFVGGSRVSWRGFCASLSDASSTKIILPEFSLAPEHPFPAAINEIKRVISEVEKQGFEIILAADASGATIALALAGELIRAGKQFLKQIVLFSPWFDISEKSLIFSVKKASDEVVNAEAIQRSADVYTYKSNLQNPLVSPMYISSEILSKFPPVYIQCGEREILLPEICKFSERLNNLNVENEVDIWPNMIHLFQMADEYLPEAHLAIEKLGKKIKVEE